MKSLLKVFIALFIIVVTTKNSISQSRAFRPSLFTWEGARTGPKAQWNADDISNIYKNIDDVDVKVTLIDPHNINTTTQNPSEFNDWTKTNTFYGKGNFAFQIVSRAALQSACLEFEFSHPVFLNQFEVWDIDMLQNSTSPLTTYQDSIHVFAENQRGSIPLVLEYMDTTSVFTIYGQSAKANFISGINGDVSHHNLAGALKISSIHPLTKFTICYANGSEDDGLSNSHAIKIPEFTFSELMGSISGKVIDFDTGMPVAGATIMLRDSNGELVVNKEGWAMQALTDETGEYHFKFLKMGEYEVVMLHPTGYENHSDIDGITDGIISPVLHVDLTQSIENNFFVHRITPLPVVLTKFEANHKGHQKVELYWHTSSEQNSDYFELFTSNDGTNYTKIGRIKSKNSFNNSYSFDYVHNVNTSTLYFKLFQIDYDGGVQNLGITSIKLNSESENIKVFPTLFSESLIITSSDKNNEIQQIIIYDQAMKAVFHKTSSHKGHEILLDNLSLPKGLYFVYVKTLNSEKTFKTIKMH